MDKIKEYKNKDQGGWILGAPCSSFSRDTWKTATGEDLNSNFGPISNPTTLKESIIRASGGLPHNIMAKPNGGRSASSGSLGRRSSGSTSNSPGTSL